MLHSVQQITSLTKLFTIKNTPGTTKQNDLVFACRGLALGRRLARYFLCFVLSTIPMGFSLEVAGQDSGRPAISLARPDGTYVLLPLSGPLHNEKVERIAREIQSLDKIIASRNASPRSESDTAMIAVAYESRNDALKELDLALRIAQQTSAGQLDEGILQKAEHYSRGANEALRSPIPTNIMVTTQITTSAINDTLHYMSKLDYDINSRSWTSYSAGDKLRIGRYVFRVQPRKPNSDIYVELVLVVSDPTKRIITPIHGLAR